MEMVSASKLSRVKAPYFATRNYLMEMESMVGKLLDGSPGIASPLMEQRDTAKNITLYIVTSDTGLCGSYNYNIIRKAEEFVESAEPGLLGLFTIGREGYNHFRRKEARIIGSQVGIYGRYSDMIADKISGAMKTSFLNCETDKVYIAYTKFSPTLKHQPAVEKILNIDKTGSSGSRCIFEPSAGDMLNVMIDKYIRYKMRAILLEAFTSEHSARRLAMKTATDNADDLTEQLTLARNKARQFAITKEVLEIAASAEALKG